MAVAGVIETKVYFRKRGGEALDSPRPEKRKRVTSRVPESSSLPQVTPQQEQHHTPPLDDIPPAPSPAASAAALPPRDPAASKAACAAALSAPWSGPVHFHDCDNEVFEDSNDISNDKVRLDPIIEDTSTNQEDPDVDSDMTSDTCSEAGSDHESVGIGGFDSGWDPDIAETDAEMDRAEHSE